VLRTIVSGRIPLGRAGVGLADVEARAAALAQH
jgi:hypothetical protein